MMTDRPNVLFVMADQYRWDYLGAQGAGFVRTPNLDRIAARGVRFTQCTTNSPVCAPARIGLATGLQPSRVGALDNSAYLPASQPTYYQYLRDHGYRVGCVGKLDLAKPAPYNGRYGDRPCIYGWGFTHPEECEGKMHAGKFPTPQGPYGYFLQERGLYQAFHEDYTARAASGKGWVRGASHDSVLPADAFEDAYIGQRAADWLAEVPDDFPWHYFVSFVGPHNPFDPPTEYADRYRNAPMPPAVVDTMEGKPASVKHKDRGLTPEEIAVTRRQYCAAIELIDDYVGRMLDALEARGQLEKTVIIFSADHGEMLGDHGLYTKSVPYEASVRVPLLVAGPDIEGGRASDALVELIDVNPTICDLVGLPAQPKIDALSLGPVLRGETADHRSETVSAIRHFRCIRTERYKYVENYNAIDELYDLENDPDELVNLAESEPELARELSRRLQARYLEGRWRR
jgi:choline-sulfatase